MFSITSSCISVHIRSLVFLIIILLLLLASLASESKTEVANLSFVITLDYSDIGIQCFGYNCLQC